MVRYLLNCDVTHFVQRYVLCGLAIRTRNRAPDNKTDDNLFDGFSPNLRDRDFSVSPSVILQMSFQNCFPSVHLRDRCRV